MTERVRRKLKTQPTSRSKDITLIPRLFDLKTGQVIAGPTQQQEEVKGDHREIKELDITLHLKGFESEESFEAPLMSERGTSATSAEGRQMETGQLTPSPQKLKKVSRTPTKVREADDSVPSSIDSGHINKDQMGQLGLAADRPSSKERRSDLKQSSVKLVESASSSTCSSVRKTQSNKSIGLSLLSQLSTKTGGKSSDLASNQRRLTTLGLVGSVSSLLQGPIVSDGFGYLYVYCVKGNLTELKIGRSKNFPDRRVSHSEATNGKKYVILETFGCNYHMLLEKSVHCELADCRVELPEHWDGRTEWFRVTWSVARTAIARVLTGINLIYRVEALT
jgi:hypothetical protein